MLNSIQEQTNTNIENFFIRITILSTESRPILMVVLSKTQVVLVHLNTRIVS